MPKLRNIREGLRQNSVCGVIWGPNGFSITFHLSLISASAKHGHEMTVKQLLFRRVLFHIGSSNFRLVSRQTKSSSQPNVLLSLSNVRKLLQDRIFKFVEAVVFLQFDCKLFFLARQRGQDQVHDH